MSPRLRKGELTIKWFRHSVCVSVSNACSSITVHFRLWLLQITNRKSHVASRTAGQRGRTTKLSPAPLQKHSLGDTTLQAGAVWRRRLHGEQLRYQTSAVLAADFARYPPVEQLSFRRHLDDPCWPLLRGVNQGERHQCPAPCSCMDDVRRCSLFRLLPRVPQQHGSLMSRPIGLDNVTLSINLGIKLAWLTVHTA